jgi:LAO/AO transport system kinase
LAAAARLALADYAAGVVAGDRAVLARAITLVESRRPDDGALARALLDRLLPRTGRAVRVGITGVPGVGKSTLIDCLGSQLTAAGRRLAVLAVDPSSSRSGGSILGDKTRMARLAADPAAYIRPSPSAGRLGGVARMTRETMLLCEAAGAEVVLVETVGVGQSETLVAEMVDCFVALMLPGAGDELQGIKKGLVELADIIAITKADGDNRLRAAQARRHYASALRMIEPATPAWRPPVLLTSALEGRGIAELWATVEAHRAALEEAGALAARRRAQQVSWLGRLLEDALEARFRAHPRVAALYPELEAAVADGHITATSAAARLLAALDAG